MQLDKLSIEDKIAIVGFIGDFVFFGSIIILVFFSFFQGFVEEKYFFVWSQVFDFIGLVKFVFGEDDVICKGFENFILKFID